MPCSRLGTASNCRASVTAERSRLLQRETRMVTRFGLLALIALSLTSSIAAQEPKPAALNQLRLYVPIPDLENRFGKDIEPLAGYIKSLEKRAGEVLAKEKQPKAKGLLIAVGIKSKKEHASGARLSKVKQRRSCCNSSKKNWPRSKPLISRKVQRGLRWRSTSLGGNLTSTRSFRRLG